MGALRAAEALVLPSHQENFGMVVAEALACGTPALLSKRVTSSPKWSRTSPDGPKRTPSTAPRNSYEYGSRYRPRNAKLSEFVRK